MKSIVVKGGSPLSGKISVAGSKNAALPILFATILTRGVSRLWRLPDIGDVRCALGILRGFGAEIRVDGDTTLIDTTHLAYSPPDPASVCRIRASTYLIGSCLSRFGECRLMAFGGCNFSDRPIDLHILAARKLGADFDGESLRARSLFGSEIDFPKPSVGATVNAILLAVSAVGETVIRGFAREPHIDSLIDFLLSAGASITRTEWEIRIIGRELHGGSISIPGDMIEAGTYLSLGIVTDGEITVTGCPGEHLLSAIEALKAFGAEIDERRGEVSARRGKEMRRAEIVATPYPGFPTDLQPIFAVVAARFLGGSITDTVWRSRFGYLNSLSRFGVDFRVEENRATIFRSSLLPSRATAPDLRGGMACIMAALAAKGESVIESAGTVERGYEELVEKLRLVGADVEMRES